MQTPDNMAEQSDLSGTQKGRKDKKKKKKKKKKKEHIFALPLS